MKISNSSLSIRSKMTLILDTGQLMMESGAGSKRIVRDMLRTAACLGIYWEDVQIHITPKPTRGQFSVVSVGWSTIWQCL